MVRAKTRLEKTSLDAKREDDERANDHEATPSFDGSGMPFALLCGVSGFGFVLTGGTAISHPKTYAHCL